MNYLAHELSLIVTNSKGCNVPFILERMSETERNGQKAENQTRRSKYFAFPRVPSPEQTKPGKLFLNKDGEGAPTHRDPDTDSSRSPVLGHPGFLLLTPAQLHVFTESPGTWV